MKRNLGLAVMLIAACLTGCQKGAEGTTYEDCILQHSQGITSDVAARGVQQSCRFKYSDTAIAKSKARPVPSDKLSALNGRGGVVDGRRFVASLYNGNKDLTVSTIEFELISQLDGTSLLYSVDAILAPQSTTAIDFEVLAAKPDTEFSWRIASAKGY